MLNCSKFSIAQAEIRLFGSRCNKKAWISDNSDNLNTVFYETQDATESLQAEEVKTTSYCSYARLEQPGPIR